MISENIDKATAKQGGCHRGMTGLAMLDVIDPAGHPAALNEFSVDISLELSGTLHRGLIEPKI